MWLSEIMWGEEDKPFSEEDINIEIELEKKINDSIKKSEIKETGSLTINSALVYIRISNAYIEQKKYIDAELQLEQAKSILERLKLEESNDLIEKMYLLINLKFKKLKTLKKATN